MKTELRTGLLAVLGIILILSVPLMGQNQGEEEYTFRNTRWGMSKSEVIEKEGEPDFYNDDPPTVHEAFLGYSEMNVGSLEAVLYYSFIEDKLVDSVYGFEESYNNKNKYIEDFERIKRILTDKYGSPEQDKERWRDDLYKDKPSRHGFAVSIGDLVYRTRWETEETIIEMVLLGDNYEISHNLYYNSKEFKEVVEEKREEQEQSQF